MFIFLIIAFAWVELWNQGWKWCSAEYFLPSPSSHRKRLFYPSKWFCYRQIRWFFNAYCLLIHIHIRIKLLLSVFTVATNGDTKYKLYFFTFHINSNWSGRDSKVWWWWYCLPGTWNDVSSDFTHKKRVLFKDKQ